MSEKVDMAVALWKGLSPMRVRRLRLKPPMNQRRLAKRAGVGTSTVANNETGKREASWSTVIAISSVFGIRPEKLWVELRTWRDDRPNEDTADAWLEMVTS